MEIQLGKCLPEFRQQINKWVIFNDEEWNVLVQFLKLKRLRKKEHFTAAGEICKELGFVLSGAMRLYHIKDGEEITGYFCLNYAFITSYKSLFKQQPGVPAIQALEETLLITLNYQALQQLFDHPVTGHKMERFCRLISENLVCCYEDRVESFVTQSPQERYAALLNADPRILQRIPQHYLAHYLGITATSLSRIRKRLFEPAK
jgi:CRP-like cAMP-binding protein